MTVIVNAGTIVADDDSVSGINGLTGAANVVNVLPGDTLNGNPATLGGGGNVTINVVTPATPVNVGNPVPSLNPSTGLVSVPAGTPAASYAITYSICEVLNPGNCDQGVATVNVIAAPIVAVDDTPSAVSGAGNPSVVNAFANDTLNGAPVNVASTSATIITPASNTGVALNPATGVVSVAPGVPAGAYTITYQICEDLNSANCDQAVVTVNVLPGVIVADNDSVSGINGRSGAANVLNVLPGDTVNGNSATLGGSGNVTMSVVTPATPVDLSKDVNP